MAIRKYFIYVIGINLLVPLVLSAAASSEAVPLIISGLVGKPRVEDKDIRETLVANAEKVPFYGARTNEERDYWMNPLKKSLAAGDLEGAVRVLMYYYLANSREVERRFIHRDIDVLMPTEDVAKRAVDSDNRNMIHYYVKNIPFFARSPRFSSHYSDLIWRNDMDGKRKNIMQMLKTQDKDGNTPLLFMVKQRAEFIEKVKYASQEDLYESGRNSRLLQQIEGASLKEFKLTEECLLKEELYENYVTLHDSWRFKNVLTCFDSVARAVFPGSWENHDYTGIDDLYNIKNNKGESYLSFITSKNIKRLLEIVEIGKKGQERWDEKR